MAVKDYQNHYAGLADPSSAAQTPNTVSRYHRTGERAWTTVVSQSGKAVLDSELQLGQDALKWEIDQLRQWEGPSGWLRAMTRRDAIEDYTMGEAPEGVSDYSGHSLLSEEGVLVNSFLLPRLVAMVAGRPVVVEYTNTQAAGWNLVELPPPTIYDGTDGTVKRTDFVFLEVWFALVAPSLPAKASVSIDDNPDIVAGDLVTIDGTAMEAVAGAPGAGEFQIGANAGATAINLATAINADATLGPLVDATTDGVTVNLRWLEPGAAGNSTTLSVTVDNVGSITVSGATFTGGADRPNKPSTSQAQIYRHGNILSPAPTWLDDQILNHDLGEETAQRVQVQYRLRATVEDQGINYKAHPDGFSNTVNPILAQAGLEDPVADYPFVPANKTTTWLDSSAVAYGIEDGGLWIAGDGSEEAAQALGTLDGYVYAIPVCFVHRHNNCSDETAALQGFDPETNANGAPTYLHEEYTGNLGTIPEEVSDRPDGALCDVVTETNLLDLRRHIMLSGFSPSSELQYQIQSLMDGAVRTWSADIADKQVMGDDSGDVSTRYLVCDEIGRNTATDGNPASTRGEFIRDFDHIARRFGAQSVIERVVFSFLPGDRTAVAVTPGTANPGKYVVKASGTDEWIEGDVLHLDLTAFDASTLGNIFDGGDGDGGSATGVTDASIAHFMPEGTVITDVLGIWHDDGNYDAAIEQTTQTRNIFGLGTQHLEITLDSNPTVADGGTAAGTNHPLVPTATGGAKSQRRIFVEVEIMYPTGVGATCTPDLVVTPDASLYDGASAGPGDQRPGVGPQIEADVTARPTDMEEPKSPLFRSTYREVQLEYVANGAEEHGSPDAGTPVTDSIVSRNRTSLYTPRRLSEGNTVTVTDMGAGGPGTAKTISGSTEYGSSSRKLVVTTNLGGVGQTLCEVTYFPQDPLPNYGPLGAGYQVAVYYRSAAPQTAGVKEGALGTSAGGVLPTILNVEPIHLSPNIWTSQIGTGSVDRAFPYGLPTNQIPSNAGDVSDDIFCAVANLSVADFDANTGLLSLHPFVQADSQNVYQFGSLASPPISDGEFRAFYRTAANWVYRPMVMAQALGGATRHKVFFPFLARIVTEVTGTGNGLLFRRNEVVLVVLSRTAVLDADNSVRFLDTDNTTAASIYRTRNLLLVAGDAHVPVPASP